MKAKREVTPPTAHDLSAYRVQRSGRGNAVADTTWALREAILDGVLAPNDWLREETLTAVLGVSRTPVREALNRLEEEGLIMRTSGQGARVTSLTIEDMSVVYQVRGSLESLAARIATEVGSSDNKQHLAALHDETASAAEAGDTVAFSRANIQFHAALTAMAGNAYLSRLLGTVETALRRFGTRSYSAERMRAIVDEHSAVLSAILGGNADAAAEAASAHAASARSATLSRFLESV